MELQNIELSKLKLSPHNVRKRGAAKDLAELIASIKSLGVIQPLLVRPNCDGFEVIAGQRRLLACQAIARETGKDGAVPCGVLAAGDDAAAIEASAGTYSYVTRDFDPQSRVGKPDVGADEYSSSSVRKPLTPADVGVSAP